MNILQFWLIDSIVKASAHSSSVALPSDSARNSLDPATEPLFRGSIDPDDDDEDGHHHDIENPRSIPRSRSASRDSKAVSPADEPKSSAATTATASGSGTVTPKIIDHSASPVVVHAYPPSLTSTASSPASSRPSSMSPPKRRRSPPPPLALRPIPHVTQLSLPQLDTSQSDRHTEVEEGHDEKVWAAWDDEHVDDWADRVGEEERVDARKAVVHDPWTEDGPLSSVRLSSH